MRSIVLSAILFLAAEAVSIPTAQSQARSDSDGFEVTGVADVAGRPARYSYYFDHNALADAVRVGDTLVALTVSGNLLRVDTRTMTLTAQAVVPGRGTAIAADDRGVVLIGTEEGEILTVDPETFAPTTLMHVGGTVRWLSREADRLVTVIIPKPLDSWPGEEDEAFERRRRALPRPFVLVRRDNHTLRHTLPADADANAFLVEGSALWLGIDRGEWGGKVLSLDLNSGRVTQKSIGNVRGLTRASDGRLLAYGGLVHFVTSHGFIARIDAGQTDAIRVFDADEPANPSEPLAPIDRIVEDRFNGGFWVLSAHTLHHAGTDFTNWSKSVSFDAGVVGGRRDSLGPTLAINDVLPGSRANELFAVSALDGIRRISSAAVQRLAFPGQLADAIVDIWPTSIGTLFLPTNVLRKSSAWRLTNGTWSATALCPERLSGKGILDVHPVADDGAGVSVYCKGIGSPDPVAVTRLDSAANISTTDSWAGGSSGPNQILMGPQRQLYGVEGWYRKGSLLEREDRQWKEVGVATLGSPSAGLAPSARQYIALPGASDDRVVFWKPADGAILRLRRAPKGDWRLELVESKQLVSVLDAVPDGSDAALLTTPHGTFRYHPASGRVERLSGPVGDQIVTVARDTSGRLWAAGDRLHVSIDDAKSWHIVDLPMVSRTRLKRLRPNHASEGGMMLSLYDRGVLVLE